MTREVKFNVKTFDESTSFLLASRRLLASPNCLAYSEHTITYDPSQGDSGTIFYNSKVYPGVVDAVKANDFRNINCMRADFLDTDNMGYYMQGGWGVMQGKGQSHRYEIALYDLEDKMFVTRYKPDFLDSPISQHTTGSTIAFLNKIRYSCKDSWKYSQLDSCSSRYGFLGESDKWQCENRNCRGAPLVMIASATLQCELGCQSLIGLVTGTTRKYAVWHCEQEFQAHFGEDKETPTGEDLDKWYKKKEECEKDATSIGRTFANCVANCLVFYTGKQDFENTGCIPYEVCAQYSMTDTNEFYRPLWDLNFKAHKPFENDRPEFVTGGVEDYTCNFEPVTKKCISNFELNDLNQDSFMCEYADNMKTMMTPVMIMTEGGELHKGIIVISSCIWQGKNYEGVEYGRVDVDAPKVEEC